jgi:hypothetical protein
LRVGFARFVVQTLGGNLLGQDTLPSFLIIILPFGLIPMCWAIYKLIIPELLDSSGISVDAEIIDLDYKMWNHGQVFFISYRFPFPTGDIIGKQRIKREHYEILYAKYPESAKTVSVKYLPKYPNISRLAGIDRDNVIRDLALFILIWEVLVLLVWLIIFLAAPQITNYVPGSNF